MVPRRVRLRPDPADRLQPRPAGRPPGRPARGAPGRRVNVVGALAPHDPAGPRLLYETRRTAEGRYDAAAHPAFVRRLADFPADGPRARPCAVAVANSSVHRAKAVKDAVPGLEAAGVSFCYPPPYSPELNPLEPVWRQAKYQALPERSHPTDLALHAAVEAALADRARKLSESAHDLPRRA